MTDDKQMANQEPEFPPVSAQEWRAKVEQDLKGADFDRALAYRGPGGWTAEPLYHPDNAPSSPDVSGFPGSAPFTRGFRPPPATPVRPPWQPAQRIDPPDPAEANRILLHGLSLGVQRVWLRLGQGGVRIGGAADMDRLLAEVEPTFIDLMVDGDPDLLGAGFFIDWAGRHGHSLNNLRGSLGVDPTACLARQGRVPGGLDAAWARAWELTRWCQDEAPGLRTLRIDTSPHHGAGASPVQELAVALSLGVNLLRRGEAAGLDPVGVARRIDTVFSVGRRMFGELAKLRAWRRLWAHLLKSCDAGAGVPHQTLHLVPSEPWITRVDPWVNMLRGTAQVFVGALAGVDSVFVDRFDRLYGVGTDHSRRVAINMHHVLAEESFLSQVADPAGGSWALEALTDQLANDAWSLFQDMEKEQTDASAMGHLEAALISGTLQARLAETADERRRDLRRRKDVVVGVSRFPQHDEKRPRADSDPSPSPEETRRKSKASVPGQEWVHLLSSVGQGTGWHDLLSATGAEQDTICEPLPGFREAQDYEDLRLSVDDVAARGSRPKVVRVHLGSAADSRARSQFAADFFAVGGLNTEEILELGDNAEDFERLADHLPWTDLEAGVLCSSDARYGELAAFAARALKAKGARRILLAGRPGELEAELREAGVDDFVFVGCDVPAVLRILVDAAVPLNPAEAG